jgi:YD repeat-containing protein
MACTNETIATPDVNFTYETNYPRLASMVDGTGTTTYSYKAAGTAGAGQVASVDGPLTNDTITMTYDDLGRMTSRLINGFGIASLDYDALGRLTEEENELDVDLCLRRRDEPPGERHVSQSGRRRATPTSATAATAVCRRSITGLRRARRCRSLTTPTARTATSRPGGSRRAVTPCCGSMGTIRRSN